MSLAELRQREVVDIMTGSRLGRVMDIEFSIETSQVVAIVVPGDFKVMNFVKGEKTGIIIPWEFVDKIGDDVILVRLDCECV